MAEPTPLVTFIIPTRNRCELLDHVVAALSSQTAAARIAEIIIVDNCSTDDTEGHVRALAARSSLPLRYHRMAVDRGPACSRNAGARQASTPFISFVDSDVCLNPDWLEIALRTLEADPAVGVIGTKLLYFSSPDRVNSFGGQIGLIGLAWDHAEAGHAADVQQPLDCLWAPTAAVLMRREVFELAGGFDERFYLFYEDSDLGWRINLLGYRCRCLPDAVAVHRVGDGSGPLPDYLMFHQCKNRLRSLIKNYGAGNLARYLPAYLGYASLDSLVRGPRLPKLKALFWNLARLPETLRERRRVQAHRRVSDGRLRPLFAPRWFPPVAVNGRRYRGLGGVVVADKPTTVPGSTGR